MQFLEGYLRALFGGDAESLNLLQILARTAVIYLFGIALVRIGKSRFIGRHTAFDTVLAIVIGSLLSRAVTETGLFYKLLLSCLLLVSLHWLFSRIAAYSDHFGASIKGAERIIIKDGEVKKEALRQSHLSQNDLLQALRLNAHLGDPGKVKEARLERNGDISVILREEDS